MKSTGRQLGITLIELMVVVAIIAIISAIAYPSYDRYVAKGKRSVAQNALLQVADRQQQFFMDNKRYAADLTNLGYPAMRHCRGS
jgi:type IV pilus assembly protein PilE